MQFTQAIAYKFDLENEQHLNQNVKRGEKGNLAQLFTASDLETTLKILENSDQLATFFIGLLFLISGLLILLANEQRLVLVH